MAVLDDYMDRLQMVFDLCDANKLGYISVDHFVDLAKEHFGADAGDKDIYEVVRVLDTEGDGKIYFSDFCKGVKQILEITGPQTPTAPIAPSPLYNIGSEETLVPIDEDANSCATSELSTFNEYDMMTDDDGQVTPARSDASLPIDVIDIHGHRRNGSSGEDSAIGGQEQRLDQEVSENENFEDYGEGEELESDADTSSTPREPSKNHLQVNHGSSRRLTSSALASQLYRATGSSAGTSRRSSCSDEIFDDIDGNFTELNDKIQRLEAQIQMLSENQVKNDDRHVRMKEENSFLVERVHMLEEELTNIRVRSQETIEEERRKYREHVSRSDKDKSREIEILSQSLQHIEREYIVLKEENPKLRAELDRLRKENVNYEEKISEAQYRLELLSNDNQELQERVAEQRAEGEQEQQVNAQLLDELSKELEELRNYKIEMESRARTHSLGPVEQGSLHKRELESHVAILKQETLSLREQNEELHAQLLNKHIVAGKGLMQNGSASLASEMTNLPRDELLKALKEQQEANVKLREYMDALMVRIMEHNPQILEITHNNNKTNS